MLNTLAASVEETKAPTSSPVNGANPKTKTQNAAVANALIATPKLASKPAETAVDFASFQLVPNPP